MSDSGMNLVEGLEDLGSLDTIEAELESLEDNDRHDPMDMMPEVTKDELIIKDSEVEEGLSKIEEIEIEMPEQMDEEDEEEHVVKEDLTIMDDEIIDEGGMKEEFQWEASKGQCILSDDHHDGSLFSEGVMGEEIISDDQIIIESVAQGDYDQSGSRMYEEDDELGEEQHEDVAAEVSIDPLGDDMEEVTAENVLAEETVVDEPLSEEMAKHFMCVSTGDKITVEPSKTISPAVYVVSSSGNVISTSQPLFQGTTMVKAHDSMPSTSKITRMILSNEGAVGGTPVRILSPQGKLMGGPTKSITVTEAKKIGIFAPNNNILPSKSTVAMPMGKMVVPSQKKTVTVTCAKSPTKILPAPNPNVQPITVHSIGPKPQKVLIRHANSLKPGTILTSASGSQMIRIPSTQNIAQGNTIHQIQLPGKQVQYVKLVGPGGGKAPTTLVPMSALSKTIPLALPTSILNSSPQTTFKVVPMSQSQQGQTVTQRVLIPASAVAQGANSAQNSQAVNNIVMLSPHLLQPVKKLKEAVIVTSQKASMPQTSASNSIISTSASSELSPEAPVASPFTPSVSMTVTSTPAQAATANSQTPSNLLSTLLKSEPKQESAWSGDETMTTLEANGIRPRKPCNCTKSMCLKLYCDCFANGEFCNQCNCTCCYNNLEHEEERQRAIKSCLERNPTAFRPKIGKSFVGSEERRHNKGCNCRRSGCLKNYCECYEAKIPCSRNCKCIGCKNIDGLPSRLGDDDRINLISHNKLGNHHRSLSDASVSQKQTYNLSTEVVRTTCECLVAQADVWEKQTSGLSSPNNGRSPNLELLESSIIKEFGNCLHQIIDCVSRTNNHK